MLLILDLGLLVCGVWLILTGEVIRSQHTPDQPIAYSGGARIPPGLSRSSARYVQGGGLCLIGAASFLWRGLGIDQALGFVIAVVILLAALTIVPLLHNRRLSRRQNSRN